jgi:hypothetical protein
LIRNGFIWGTLVYCCEGKWNSEKVWTFPGLYIILGANVESVKHAKKELFRATVKFFSQDGNSNLRIGKIITLVRAPVDGN